MRESLSRKGKYLLGITDNLIANSLKRRIFTDTGDSSEFKTKILDVIAKLKDDADNLIKNNFIGMSPKVLQ